MPDQKAANEIIEGICVTREEIARAKMWILEHSNGQVPVLSDDWLKSNERFVPNNAKIDVNALELSSQLAHYAKAFSLKLAYFQAIWELIAAAEIIPLDGTDPWTPVLGYVNHGFSSALDLKRVKSAYPRSIMRSFASLQPSVDPDVFLGGAKIPGMHQGILFAIKQSIECFCKGLYLPSIAMLAAATEAIWTECGNAIAKKTSNPTLIRVIGNEESSIKSKVEAIRKFMESSPEAKAILVPLGIKASELISAEIWTTNLRERRNALHWDKAQSFVLDHSESASLLMGAPMHLKMLEAVRGACLTSP